MTKEPQTITLPDGSVWELEPLVGAPAHWPNRRDFTFTRKLDPDPFGEVDASIGNIVRILMPPNAMELCMDKLCRENLIQQFRTLMRAVVKLCDGRYQRK